MEGPLKLHLKPLEIENEMILPSYHLTEEKTNLAFAKLQLGLLQLHGQHCKL